MKQLLNELRQNLSRVPIAEELPPPLWSSPGPLPGDRQSMRQGRSEQPLTEPQEMPYAGMSDAKPTAEDLGGLQPGAVIHSEIDRLTITDADFTAEGEVLFTVTDEEGDLWHIIEHDIGVDHDGRFVTSTDALRPVDGEYD